MRPKYRMKSLKAFNFSFILWAYALNIPWGVLLGFGPLSTTATSCLVLFMQRFLNIYNEQLNKQTNKQKTIALLFACKDYPVILNIGWSIIARKQYSFVFISHLPLAHVMICVWRIVFNAWLCGISCYLPYFPVHVVSVGHILCTWMFLLLIRSVDEYRLT